MNVSTDNSTLGILDQVAALKRERIIESAANLFYERGYESTTLDAVAERLGVTKPFIYAHFESKADLLAEICARGIGSSTKAIESTLRLELSPTEKLQLLGERFVTAVLESQMYIAIFTREEKNLLPKDFARINEMRRAFDVKLNKLLKQGIAAGEFRIQDSRIAALAIGGMVSWAYVWYRPDGRLPLPELAEQMASLILSLVGVTRKPTRVASGRGTRAE